MFAILPVGMNYQTQRLPVVTFSLIGINTLVWLVSTVCYYSTSGESQLWIFDHLWLIPAESSLLTYLTSMFVHSGFFHLLGNMVFLFLFGCCVEDIIGRFRFALLYLAGGVVAELAHIAFSPEHFNSDIPMGGASGAISACMGMYLLLRAGADIEFKYFYWFFFAYLGAGEFTLPAWVAITFWFLKDVFWMVLGWDSHHAGGGTAFGAHVGGFLAGLAAIGLLKLFMHGQLGVNAEEEVRPIITPAPIRVRVQPRRVAEPVETPTIYLHDGAQQTGPFTLSQVQGMLRTGQINHGVQYWSDGLDEWRNVAELSDRPGG
jgi:membrane associated rhomboid family serine protease